MDTTTRSEQIVSIVMRSPSVFMLEFLYHESQIQLLKESEFMQTELLKSLGTDIQTLSTCIQYIGYMVVLALLSLPIHQLKSFYAHLATFTMLVLSKSLSTNFITSSQDPDNSPDQDHKSYTRTLRLVTYASTQGLLILICALLMGTKRHWTFSAFLAPVIMNVFCMEPRLAEKTHMVACWVTVCITVYYLASNFWTIFKVVSDQLIDFTNFIQQHDIAYLIQAVFKKAFIAPMFVCFWLGLFIFHFVRYIDYTDNGFNFKDRWLIMVFAMIADSCQSPWGLIGLCYIVSYTACFIHTACRIYLMGFSGQVQDTTLFNGSIEGLTLLILALQTSLLGLERVEKIFSLGIVLFIVTSSSLQSLYEMTSPVLLLLSSSNNRKWLSHVRVLIFVFTLIVIPIIMTYYLTQIFSSNIWMIIISLSCLLTSLHMLSSLMVYVLFMIDNFRREPWENLDDVVYFIHGFGHALEFVVAVCGVCSGGFDAVFTDLSISGSFIILVHFYVNVWKVAKSGWQSVNRRRGAMKKITILRQANKDELESLDDVCAICYERMTSARVTPCSHYFHGACLKKWLYVKDKCPMCHRSIIEGDVGHDSGDTEDIPAAPVNVNIEQSTAEGVRLRSNVAGHNGGRVLGSTSVAASMVHEISANVATNSSGDVALEEECTAAQTLEALNSIVEEERDVAATILETSNNMKQSMDAAETLSSEQNSNVAATSKESND